MEQNMTNSETSLEVGGWSETVMNPTKPTPSFPVSNPHKFFTVRHPPSKILTSL